MDNSEPNSLGPRGASDDLTTEARLAAIESHLQQIEAVLIGVAQFGSRLDQIHATLELAIGVITPGQHTMPAGSEQNHRQPVAYRVARILDSGSSRISGVTTTAPGLFQTCHGRTCGQSGSMSRHSYATPRSGLASTESRCWCEVWTPDETGELVDAAYLDPESGVIEWQSDMDSGT